MSTTINSIRYPLIPGNYEIIQQCSLCLEPTEQETGEDKGLLTHQNAQSHGFHISCIKPWVLIQLDKTTCPVCRQPIDGSSIVTLTDRVIRWLKSPPLNAAVYSTCFGLGITEIARLIIVPLITAIQGTAPLETPSVPGIVGFAAIATINPELQVRVVIGTGVIAGVVGLAAVANIAKLETELTGALINVGHTYFPNMLTYCCAGLISGKMMQGILHRTQEVNEVINSISIPIIAGSFTRCYSEVVSLAAFSLLPLIIRTAQSIF